MNKLKLVKPILVALVLCNLQGIVAAQSPAKPENKGAIPAAASAKRWGGPLGVQMGLTKKQLEMAGINLESTKPGVAYHGLAYYSESAPNPHKAFEYYRYSIGPKSGLCAISAYTPFIEANGSGDQLKAEFSRLENEIKKKYGKPQQFRDYRNPDKTNDPNNWLEALSNDEVHHGSVWENSKDLRLPNSLDKIMLIAEANANSKGKISLIYLFKNLVPCAAENPDIKNSPL